MKIGLCVVSYERPQYLYVSLDSIFKMHGVDNCPVVAFLIENDTLADRVSIISNLAVSIELTSLTGGESFIYALKVMFEKYNCDAVILLPDDALGRTDSIDYIRSLDNSPNVLTVCLASANIVMGKDYPWVECMGGFVFFKDKFELVDNFMYTPEFEDLLADNLGPQLGSNRWFDIDTFLCRLVVNQVKLNGSIFLAKYPSIAYGVGFGITGMHRSNTPLYYEVEKKFFQGEKETWLYNVINCLSDKSIPEEISSLWYPRDFKYQ